jgi:hypothetical protein
LYWNTSQKRIGKIKEETDSPGLYGEPNREFIGTVNCMFQGTSTTVNMQRELDSLTGP